MSRKGEFFTAPFVWSRSPHGAKRNAGVAVRYGEGRAWISLAPSGLWRGARSIERSSAVGSATAGDLGQHGGQIRASAVAHHQRHDGRIGPTYGSVKKKGVLHRRDGEELPAPQGGESSGACSFLHQGRDLRRGPERFPKVPSRLLPCGRRRSVR